MGHSGTPRRVKAAPRVFLLVLAMAPVCPAATITVALTGGGDFTELQPALDAAADGDTVLVTPGEYLIAEPLDFNRLLAEAGGKRKNLTLRSKMGPEATVIRMIDTPSDPDRASVMILQNGESETSAVIGFTLTGGRRTGGYLRAGGGLHLRGADPRIEGCSITGNTAVNGGGVYCGDDAAPTFVNCTIGSNSAALGGGVCVNDAAPSFERCTITGNTATTGGGIYCLDAASTFSACLVLGNAALEDRGGGVYSCASEQLLEDCVISENAGGGFACFDGEFSTLQRCTLERNWGSGFYCDGSYTDLAACRIAGNRTATLGGGILWRNGSISFVDACVVAGNMADVGGGICIVAQRFGEETGPVVVNTTVAYNWAARGAGVYSSSSSPIFVNCTIAGNRGTTEAGVAADFTLPHLSNSIIWDNEPASTVAWMASCVFSEDPRFLRSGSFQFDRFATIAIAERSYQLPDFVVEAPDYRLQEDSSALDAANIEDAPPTDAQGAARPCGHGVDIGAYERGSCSATYFKRGDVTGDGRVNVSDGVLILRTLFQRGAESACADAADFNDDGGIDIADAVTILSYLFTSAPQVPDHVVASVGTCARDAMPDDLPPCSYESCTQPENTYFDRFSRGETLLAFCFEPPSSGFKDNGMKIASSKYLLLRRDMMKVIPLLKPRHLVSVVFFLQSDQRHLVFGDPPIPMDEEGKAQLEQFLDKPPVYGSDCVIQGLERIFRIVNNNHVWRTEVVFAGDGELGCSGNPSHAAVLQRAGQLNVNEVPINTIYCGNAGAADQSLLRNMSESTGGWYRTVGSAWDPAAWLR